MNSEEVLAAARDAKPKPQIEDYGEAVHELRNKGYSWREIADFLTERGVQTDHTRVYRAFGKPYKQEPGSETRDVEVSSARYLGERKTKKGKTWTIFELEVESKLGESIALTGYVWGSGSAKIAVGEDGTAEIRNPKLEVKVGGNFPLAFVRAEFKNAEDAWFSQELYVAPKWEALI